MVALGTARTRITSLPLVSTTSLAYVNKATLTTPVVPAGDYVIFLTFLYQNHFSENEDFQLEIVEDAAGADLQIYETGRLLEANPGTDPGDSQDAYAICIRRTLAAGVHTYDVNFRVVGGTGDPVALSSVRMEFFGVDANYQEAASDGESQTSSTSYQNKLTLSTGAIPAGTYRIGFSMEYRCQDPTNGNNMGCRWREVRDPAGAAVVTNLLGADSGNALELEVNNGGFGVGSSDPHQAVTWWTACRELAADSYEYELDFRAVGGLFDDVEVSLARINFWRTDAP